MVDRQQLQETYRAFSDEQLLRLAADLGSLTDEARDVLSQELQRRKLGENDLAPYREELAQIIRQRNEPPSRSTTLITGGLSHALGFGILGSYLYKTFRDIAIGKQSSGDKDSGKPRR